jgi:hypothetical protein
VSESVLIVVDWTGSILEIGVFARSVHGCELRSSFTLPTRIALRQNRQGEISYSFAADQVGEDDHEHTIVFEHPGRQLPNIEDVDLQTELLRSLWQGLQHSMTSAGALRPGEVASVYLIPPLRFTLPLFEQLRRCAAETPLRLCSVITPATALVMGALGLETFVEDLTRIVGSDEIAAGCFVLSEDFIEAVCFEYRASGPQHQSIRIVDYFQVTSGELARRLQESDSSDLNFLLVVEDSEGADSANALLQQLTRAGELQYLHRSSRLSLRLMGCAEVAKFAAGWSAKPDQYEISHLYNLGIQINQSRFQPLITREQLRSGKFPTANSQSFRLSRKPANGLRLNFCSGYSTAMAESTSLGRVMLPELDAITVDTFLAASIKLDTLGSGEFFLGLMPENRILRQQSFMLPGLA